MSRERTAIDLKQLLAIVGVVLLVTTPVLLNLPEASAQRSGRGSVRQSSGSRRTGTTASPSRSGTSRRGTSGRGASAARGRRGGRRADARYSARKDARRDYRRWRAATSLIRLGVYLATRPRYSTTVVVTGTTYYYAGGVYYVPSGTGYVVAAAPLGVVVHAVPTATTVVYVGSTPYYYYGGTYYVTTTQPAPQPQPAPTTVNVNVKVTGSDATAAEAAKEPPMTSNEQNYEAVSPPVGVTVPYLPDEADEQMVGGKKYFVYDGSYYRPFASDGETIYMVVEDPR